MKAEGVELGRGTFGGTEVDDERVSRKHAKVALDGARWTITDHGSRNGTFVDGEKVTGARTFDAPRVVHVGRSIFLPVRDVRRFERSEIERRGATVVGPTLRDAYARIERAARAGGPLLVSGESGAGKELAARAFHAAGPRAGGPFVAVNCAAIPEGLAERLLFGAKKGAYSGATQDADGYVQTADKGTLFLDEVAELDAAVQAKLLRVLETKEVLALGASRPRAVDIQVCSATRDLRAEVAAGRFREDLYFRVGRPEVVLPPLRERLEEIPWLVAAELGRVPGEVAAGASFVEACMLRAWPGNVRELLGEVRRAAHDAAADGRSTLEAKDLGDDAGRGFAREREGAPAQKKSPPEKDEIEEALRSANGNVTRAARALGMHRNQLRRWLAKNGVKEE
jgi:transcriptional regulator with PAS, ATPase and Fis domain